MMLRGVQGLGDVNILPSDALYTACAQKYPLQAPSFWQTIFSGGIIPPSGPQTSPQFNACIAAGGASATLPPPDYSTIMTPGLPTNYDPSTGTCGGQPCGNPALPGPSDFPVESTPYQPSTPGDYAYSAGVAATSWLKSNGLLLLLGGGLILLLVMRSK